MPIKNILTVVDKILLHLAEIKSPQWSAGAPYAATQNGMADRTGIRRSHVPRAIRTLSQRGLVTQVRSHVKGSVRSRRAYILSFEGMAAARRLHDSLQGLELEIILPGGPGKKPLREIDGALGTAAGTLDILIASERGPVSVNSFSGALKECCFSQCLEAAPAARPFFGRSGELEKLAVMLREGKRLIMINGISGIGKTSLALQLVKRAEGRMHILWLAIHEWDAVSGLLRPLADFLSRTGRRKLSSFLEGKGAADPGPVLELLVCEFRELEALIVVDDLHKAQSPVTEMVSAVAQAALLVSGPSIVVLSREKRALCNPDALSGGLARELTLGGLDLDSASSLVPATVPPSERKKIIAASDGHPLFIEYLAQFGPSGGKSSVREHLRREIFNRLLASEKSVLGLASVYGRAVPAAALLSGDEGAELIDSLCDRHLLGRSEDGSYSMHDLLRDFFHSRLSPSELAGHHGRASAFFLEGGLPGTAGHLEAIRHLVLAGERASAARLTLQTGESIVSAGSGDALLTGVLDILSPPDFRHCPDNLALPVDAWLQMVLLRASILSARGETDRALRDYSIVAGTGGIAAAEALCGAGAILEGRCDWDGAASSYTRSCEITGAFAPEALRGAARVAWRRGEYERAQEKFRLALKAARRTGRRDLEAMVLTDMGNLVSDRGDSDAALSLYRDALKMLEAEGVIREAARVHNNLGALLFYDEKFDAAMEQYDKALTLSQNCGDVSTVAYAQSNIGQILARQGEEERALKILDQSSTTFERLHDGFMLSSNIIARGILYRVLCQYPKAEMFFVQGLSMLESLGMPRETAEAQFEFGLLLKGNGDTVRARRALSSARTGFLKLGARREAERAETEIKSL